MRSGRAGVAACALQLVVAVALCASLCGCEDGIDSVYGQRKGPRASASVNGTAVLGSMFEAAGHKVSSWWALSPRLRERADCIVWFPDDVAPPDAKVREWFEQWLAEDSDRTLIYVGRDYDAAGWYWDQVRPSIPPAQAKEAGRRRAEAKSDFLALRAGLPKSEDCDWFVVKGPLKQRKVRTLQGDPEWLRGVDPSKLEIELFGRIEPPAWAQPRGTLGRLLSGDWRGLVEPPAIADEHPEYEVLLESEGDLLVSRQVFEANPWGDALPEGVAWGGGDSGEYYIVPGSEAGNPFAEPAGSGQSQLIVVANGSFLLNLPLVNHEHRKLAGKLIDRVGPPSRNVVFLESGPGGPQILEKDPRTRMPSGMELLVSEPTRWIFIQLAIVGALFCFARWPIFGVPRQLEVESRTDFGKHVQALGELLARSRDRAYAMTRLMHYQQTVRRE